MNPPKNRIEEIRGECSRIPANHPNSQQCHSTRKDNDDWRTGVKTSGSNATLVGIQIQNIDTDDVVETGELKDDDDHPSSQQCHSADKDDDSRRTGMTSQMPSSLHEYSSGRLANSRRIR